MNRRLLFHAFSAALLFMLWLSVLRWVKNDGESSSFVPNTGHGNGELGTIGSSTASGKVSGRISLPEAAAASAMKAKKLESACALIWKLPPDSRAEPLRQVLMTFKSNSSTRPLPEDGANLLFEVCKTIPDSEMRVRRFLELADVVAENIDTTKNQSAKCELELLWKDAFARATDTLAIDYNSYARFWHRATGSWSDVTLEWLMAFFGTTMTLILGRLQLGLVRFIFGEESNSPKGTKNVRRVTGTPPVGTFSFLRREKSRSEQKPR